MDGAAEQIGSPPPSPSSGDHDTEDWQSIRDPTERKRVRNRLAQRKHRQKLKNTRQTPRSQSYSQGDETARSVFHSYDGRNGQTRNASQNLLDITDPLYFMDEGSPKIMDNPGSATSGPLGTIAQLRSSPFDESPNLEEHFDPLLDSFSPIFNRLSANTTSEGNGVESQPIDQWDPTSGSLPNRVTNSPYALMEEVVKMSHIMGFTTLDKMIVAYYTESFHSNPSLAFAQASSRRHHVADLIGALYDSSFKWESRASQALKSALTQSAEKIYANELRSADYEAFVGKTAQFSELTRLIWDLKIIGEQKDIREFYQAKAPETWSLILKLVHAANVPKDRIIATATFIFAVLCIQSSGGQRPECPFTTT